MSDDTVDALLAEWRRTRSPATADEIQRRTPKGEEPKELLTFWRGKTTSEGELNLAALAQLPDDPRMTVMFVKCLHAARWPGSGARKLWTAITERLVTLKDVRAVPALRAAAAAPPHFVGIAHTKWVQERLRETADALESACAGQSIPEPSEWFVRAGAPSSPKGTVDAVWANPNDDATRLVVADALMEKGDPWGEFITLGFKSLEKDAPPEIEERLATLLHKHAQIFGGPIAFIATKNDWLFEKGFLVSVTANRSQMPRRRWEEAAAAPHWATVRELVINRRNTPIWWLAELLKNPATAGIRTISGLGGALRLLRTEPGGTWRVESASSHSDLRSWLLAFFRALDDAAAARVEIGDDVGEDGRREVERARIERSAKKPPA